MKINNTQLIVCLIIGLAISTTGFYIVFTSITKDNSVGDLIPGFALIIVGAIWSAMVISTNNKNK